MKSIFYVLAILVIGAAGYFAFDLKNKMTAEIALYEETKDENERVDVEITATEKTLADTKTSLGTALDKKASLESTQGNEESKKRTYLAAIEGYDRDIAGYDAELKQVQEAIAKIEELLGGINVGIEEIPGKLEDLKNRKLDLQKNLEKLTEQEAKLNREVAGNRSKIENLNDRFADIREKIERGAQVGTVTAVDPVWGFVIVNQGVTNSNVTEESSLLVSRGGRYLGRLKVTSLEPNQSICDMEDGSFRTGVRVQPGDSVIIANPGLN
jgi:predicted RNase H-like nuclease (RuvC/YqgF family)